MRPYIDRKKPPGNFAIAGRDICCVHASVCRHYVPTRGGHVAGQSPLETASHCCRTRWFLFANVCREINYLIGNQRPEDGGFVAMLSNGRSCDREVSIAA